MQGSKCLRRTAHYIVKCKKKKLIKRLIKMRSKPYFVHRNVYYLIVMDVFLHVMEHTFIYAINVSEVLVKRRVRDIEIWQR